MQYELFLLPRALESSGQNDCRTVRPGVGPAGRSAGQTEDAYEQYMAGVADFAEKASGAGIIVVLRLWNRGHDGGRNDRTFTYLRERLEGEWAENTRGILCDGTVVPCCLDSEGVIDLGNVLDGSSASLADILSSPRAQAMVKGFEYRKATEELCRRCGYAQRFV